MAYQAFYNKYRPQTFDEVVGQKAIVETLKNAIKENKIAHAYLFCGPRGTGKTTMARLFAKALNCQEGIGKQCNHCESCLDIIKGDHPDVFEIDAASNSTVDSVRQLIENVSYQPIMSPYKIYIIDEVHNMSNSAFNALLKTLEEPPSFVIFILATTEPQKILPTILSRVQRFDFSKVSEKDLINNMKRVLDNEKIKYEDEALRLISSLSDGGVRDSLSLLDKLVSYSGETLTVKDVNEMLGLLSLKDEINIVNSISERKTKDCLNLVKEKYNNGMDIIRLHNELIHIYKDFLIFMSTKDESLLDRLNKEEVRLLHISINEARYCIKTLMDAKREYRITDDIFSHFELTLLNLMDDEEKEDVKKEEKSDKVNNPVLDKKANTLASVPQEISSAKEENKGVLFETKKEIIDDSLIKYSINDILNLMVQADKEERVSVSEKWNNIQNLFYDEKLSYESKALFNFKLRMIAQNIIVVSTKFQNELEKINKKESQNNLTSICNSVFGKNYNVLPILESDYLEAVQSFRSGNKPNPQTPTIDFGLASKNNESTQFLDNLMNN